VTDRDLQIIENRLNGAIVNADIGRSIEECLQIFDAFYVDEIVVDNDSHHEPIGGKAAVRSFLFDFLLPLHVLTEVGGMKLSVRAEAIQGDIPNETHSRWTMDVIGAYDAKCTLTWSVLRMWSGPRVVYERQCDLAQTGDPLTFDDLRFSGVEVSA
jgi:hypothetical protein